MKKAMLFIISSLLLVMAMHTPMASREKDKVKLLRKRVDSLEKRVTALENILTSASGKKSYTGNLGDWKNRQNWRQLEVGMTEDQVRSLLGEPRKVDVGAVLVFWYYGNSSNVNFDTDSKRVSGWGEP